MEIQSPQDPRFNGATTFQLWRSVSRVLPSRGTCQASMGPQLFSCGDFYGDYSLDKQLMLLQWGHNFSVVEID